ncbi:hypothetical protein ACLOJK_028643 [Asimina triloba]
MAKPSWMASVETQLGQQASSAVVPSQDTAALVNDPVVRQPTTIMWASRPSTHDATNMPAPSAPIAKASTKAAESSMSPAHIHESLDVNRQQHRRQSRSCGRSSGLPREEVDQSFADKFQGDMEEGVTDSAETKLEGHGKGKEIHYEDFSKYQPKVPFPSALEGKPIGKQKLDQNEDSSDQMLEKEVLDETKAPTEAKFASQMEEAEKVEQELPKPCIPVMSSMPPSINLNEEKAPQVRVRVMVIK